MKRWVIALKVFVVAVVLLYGAAGFAGYRLMSGDRDRIDPSVRSSPGGYRSFHFWHSGFSGGK